MAVPDFLIWHCANCGAGANGTRKPCECATNVGVRTGPNGEREQTWWDDPKVAELSELRATIATQAAQIEALTKALAPLAALPVGAEIEDDRDLVIYKNAGKSITVGDILDARAALSNTGKP